MGCFFSSEEERIEDLIATLNNSLKLNTLKWNRVVDKLVKEKSESKRQHYLDVMDEMKTYERVLEGNIIKLSKLLNAVRVIGVTREVSESFAQLSVGEPNLRDMERSEFHVEEITNQCLENVESQNERRTYIDQVECSVRVLPDPAPKSYGHVQENV